LLLGGEGAGISGCCPNKNPFERSLRRFLAINLGEAEDQRFQLLEPEGRVLKSPGASLRFIKKRLRQSEKGFGQQPGAMTILTMVNLLPEMAKVFLLAPFIFSLLKQR